MKTATPAERLAKKVQRERKPRNATPPVGPLQCRCRELRESLGLTIRQVADGVGMSIAGYHAVEHGRDVQMTTAIKLAAFYGRTVGDLWTVK